MLLQDDAESLHCRLEQEEQIAEALQTRLYECAEVVDRNLRCRNEQLVAEVAQIQTQIKTQRTERVWHRIHGSTPEGSPGSLRSSGKASFTSVLAELRRASLKPEAQQPHSRLTACDFGEFAAEFEKEVLELERENEALKMRLSLCETDKDEMQEAAIEERQMVLGMEEQRAIKHAKKLAVEEDLQSIEFEYRCLVGQDCALEDGIETAMEAQQQRRETNLKRVEDMLETEQAIASEQVNHLKRQMEEMEWHSERLEEEIQKLQSKCELHDMRRKNLIRGNNMDLTLDLQLERGKRKTQFGNQRIALLLDSGSEDDSRLHQPRWVSVLHDELDALHRQLTITRDLYLEAVQDEQEAVLDMLTPRSGDSHLSDHQLLQRLFDAAARYGQSNKERTRESEIMDLERRVSLQRKEAALLQERLDQNHSAEHIELQDTRGKHQELQQQLE